MRRCRTLIVALLACAMLPASAHQVAASSELARRALIIGVSEYSHVLSLDHADSDARHFYRMLTNPDVGGVYGEDVRFLSTMAPGVESDLPTRENILRALDALAATPQVGGTLWFYFSGHGMELNRFSHIAPMDADPTGPLTEQLISMADVRSRLKMACPDGTIVIALDACQSGSPRSVRFRDMAGESEETAPGRANVITAAAADVNQSAMEVVAPPGGVFTYFFVRALCGDADANQDGVVYASEAKDYVCSRVSGFARRWTGADQSPQFILHQGHDVALTRSSTPAIESMETLGDDLVVAPGAKLTPGVVLAIEGDQENLAMRAFAKAVPAEEYRLVDSGAAATMSAVSTALGPSRGRTAQVDIGARYLVVIKVSTPTQYYRQTDSYKCIASVLVQVFDESGQLIGIAEQEATRPAFDEHESVRTALRAACSALVGTPQQSRFLEALRGGETQ